MIATVANGIDLLGYSSAIKFMITGAILLAAVTLDTISAGGSSAQDARSDGALKTSLGIWALGPMITRFVPRGYQPEHADESTVAKVRRAVEGLGDLMDDYEFHYPGELNPDNLDDVRDALDGHGIATVCTGLHTRSAVRPGGLTSPDAAVRAEARRLTRETAEMAGRGRREHDLLAGDRGLQLPVPDARTRSRGSGSSTGWRRRPRPAPSTASSSSSSTRTPSRR